MPKYSVEIVELNRTTYKYLVDASDAEDALDLASSGEVDPVYEHSKFIDGDFSVTELKSD